MAPFEGLGRAMGGGKIREIADGALERMREIGYSDKSVKEYAFLFEGYARLADERGEVRPSKALDEAFVEKRRGAGSEKYAKDRAQRASRACRVLTRFMETGDIPGRLHDEPVAPASSAAYLELYLAECAERGLSKTTLSNRQADLCEFLWFVERAGADFPSGVDLALVEGWAGARAAAAPGGMQRCLSSVRCLLEHLFTIGVTEANLACLVPSAGRYPTKSVSKVWTEEEVNRLVASIKASDSAGMRDKAVCLLLATYGMRSGDVCSLRLDDLDFDAETISFDQNKTGDPVTLPMTGGVGWALAQWIRHGRPERATCREVFTQLVVPFGPLTTVGNILKKRMAEAGVLADPSAKSGPHSLRHTVVTRLVSTGAEIPVVSSVTGQALETTTMIYLHADIEQLRRCALGEGVI